MEVFPLGGKLRDKITGFEGVAVGRHHFMSGTVQYQLIPTVLNDKGMPPEAVLLDWQHLERSVGDAAAEIPESVAAAVPQFAMGDAVEDTVTDYAGIVISKSEFINGCVQYGVQSKTLDKGDMIRPRALDSHRLRLRVHGGVRVPSAPTGGPELMPM